MCVPRVRSVRFPFCPQLGIPLSLTLKRATAAGLLDQPDFSFETRNAGETKDSCTPGPTALPAVAPTGAGAEIRDRAKRGPRREVRLKA